MSADKLERLALAGIQMIPVDLKQHCIFERGGFVALVERREEGFGPVGAAGLLTDRGLAPLVWRDERAYFVSKGFEQEATEEQVGLLRRFQADLESVLR